MYDAHHIANDKEPPQRADICGYLEPAFFPHCSGQGPDLPNAFGDWGATTLWTQTLVGPSLQEVVRGSEILRTPYPDTSPTAHEFPRWNLDGPTPPYLPADTVMNNVPHGTLEEMERQSASETIHMDRSLSGPAMPSSALMDRDVPMAWSGPAYILSASNHDDRGPLGVLPSPLGHLPSRRPATVLPFLTLVPTNWRKIPQERYTPKAADRSFLRLEQITFVVDGVQGFNMRRARGKNFTGLEGRDHHVLENANGPVSCRLLFPGYPTNTQRGQIPVKDYKKNPAPITRSKLAFEIAKRVDQYLCELATTPMDPSADPQWMIGQDHMKLEKMYLVNFSWVSKGSLQPEIWVDVGEYDRH